MIGLKWHQILVCPETEAYPRLSSIANVTSLYYHIICIQSCTIKKYILLKCQIPNKSKTESGVFSWYRMRYDFCNSTRWTQGCTAKLSNTDPVYDKKFTLPYPAVLMTWIVKHLISDYDLWFSNSLITLWQEHKGNHYPESGFDILSQFAKILAILLLLFLCI